MFGGFKVPIGPRLVYGISWVFQDSRLGAHTGPIVGTVDKDGVLSPEHGNNSLYGNPECSPQVIHTHPM